MQLVVGMMKGIRFHVVVFCCFVHYILAASLPNLSPRNSTDISKSHATPSLYPAKNSTNLFAPEPPAGFSIRYIDWRHVILTPTQMCINAIELMYYLTQLPWNSAIETTIIMSGPKFITEVVIDIPLGQGRLQPAYAAQGLYQMGVRMAEEKRYFLQWGRIFVNGAQKGIIRFQQLSDTTSSNLQIAGSELPESPRSANGSILDLDAFANSETVEDQDQDQGKIFDPKDKRLMIVFNFHKSKIPGADIFTSFLDGLATATEHHQDEVGAFLSIYSASLSTSFYVHHLDSPRYYRRGLTWGVLARVLILVWEQLIMGNSPGRRGRLPRYEALDFDIYREGEKIGVGELWSTAKSKPWIAVSK